MCGRFALITPPVRLARYFQATLDDGVDPEKRPSWNVAPTTQVLGVTARHPDGGDDITRTLTQFRWGLIPSWAKDASAGSRLFNARGETVATKPSFRAAFKARRIIVPADGFYEWHKVSNGSKQPHYFTRADGEPMAFAGLSEWWRDKNGPDDAPAIRSCTIITTSASQDMDGIHDRMPAILSPDTFDVWLDPDGEDTSELTSLLHGPPSGTVTHHRVGQGVGSVRNNDAGLIEPV
jgi:putative SOS response-associated peptidase YedK